MRLALLLALISGPFRAIVLDQTVTVPAADWRAFGIPIRRAARVECDFAAVEGGSGVRVSLMGPGHRTLAATDYRRSGGFSYAAAPGVYMVVVDNGMDERDPAQVHLRVRLVFEDAAPAARTLTPGRRTVVVGGSVLAFAAIALFAGRKLWPALAARGMCGRRML